jgi:glycerol kinase
VTVLVVDVGTSGVRAAAVTDDGEVRHAAHRAVVPTSPALGYVEFDATALARAALDVARAALAAAGPVDAVGIANQRCSTILWDRATGEPAGPGISWQDLRTVGTCLMLRQQGLRLSPNMSATKLAYLLDVVDPARERDLVFGTVDTWIAWQLSEGSAHVTDASNAAVTAMLLPDASGWSPEVLEALRIPERALPSVVDSSGYAGQATALAGAPPITSIVGDQQASLVGQSCTRPGLAKATFGTGGMLDVCVGARPGFDVRGEAGCFPIVAWRRDGRLTWGVEAIMLTAGSAVEWLRDDLAIIESAADSETVAGRCADSGGVWFVPALLGLGTPKWDLGARGTLLGLTRGSGRPELVRAVLEGVAHRAADLLESVEVDARLKVASLRVDGGMSANRVFVQALADCCGCPVEPSRQVEATTLGAAYLAGLAVGTWADEEEIAALWSPRTTVEPAGRPDRDRWREAVERASGWIPGLSDIDF